MPTREDDAALRVTRVQMVEEILATGGGLDEALAQMPNGWGGARPDNLLRRYIREKCGRPDLAKRLLPPREPRGSGAPKEPQPRRQRTDIWEHSMFYLQMASAYERRVRSEALIEDVTFLIQHRVHPDDIARRLRGARSSMDRLRAREAITRALQRAGRFDLARVIQPNPSERRAA